MFSGGAFQRVRFFVRHSTESIFTRRRPHSPSSRAQPPSTTMGAWGWADDLTKAWT